MLCDAVDNAKAAGTVVVASAGNSGDWGNPENVPASCDGTFTVAALSPTLNRTYWSSFDAAVDIAAPGEDVLSVGLDGRAIDPPRRTCSPAAPRWRRQWSRVLPRWSSSSTPAGRRTRSRTRSPSTAKDLGVPGRDPNYGWGVVDAANAVGAVAPAPKPQNFFATWYEPVVGWQERRVGRLAG